MSWPTSVNGTPGQEPMTEESLRAAFDKIANEPVQRCGVTYPHVVNPRAEGWTMCGNCLGPVFVSGEDG